MIAIMQPTFLPWIGYFSMIDRVDTFVFLDSVQLNKRSWQQRNRIKTAQGEMWLTVPVQTKGKRDQLIREALVLHDDKFPKKMIQAISQSYAQAPYFKEYGPAILGILEKKIDHLAELNIQLILEINRLLGLEGPKLIRSSELEHVGAKADLLVDICETLGAKSYLSAPGSREYIEASGAFGSAGIEVAYHAYQHPAYAQLYGDFIPYLSVIDLLFNEGPRSLEIIRSGVEANTI